MFEEALTVTWPNSYFIALERTTKWNQKYNLIKEEKITIAAIKIHQYCLSTSGLFAHFPILAASNFVPI